MWLQGSPKRIWWRACFNSRERLKRTGTGRRLEWDGEDCGCGLLHQLARDIGEFCRGRRAASMTPEHQNVGGFHLHLPKQLFHDAAVADQDRLRPMGRIEIPLLGVE